jgi:hypothetical protein
MRSDLTQQRLHDAMRAFEYSGPDADPGELRGAAQAHVSASRPLAIVQAEYKASLEHPAPDLVLQQELADELQPLRQAQSILDGAYPGTGITVTAEG